MFFVCAIARILRHIYLYLRQSFLRDAVTNTAFLGADITVILSTAPVQRRTAQRAVRCNRLLGAGASIAWCVRIKDHRLLADFYFPVLEAASTLVNVEDSTGSGLLCIDKPEGARDRAFAEQALART